MQDGISWPNKSYVHKYNILQNDEIFRRLRIIFFFLGRELQKEL